MDKRDLDILTDIYNGQDVVFQEIIDAFKSGLYTRMKGLINKNIQNNKTAFFSNLQTYMEEHTESIEDAFKWFGIYSNILEVYQK